MHPDLQHVYKYLLDFLMYENGPVWEIKKTDDRNTIWISWVQDNIIEDPDDDQRIEFIKSEWGHLVTIECTIKPKQVVYKHRSDKYLQKTQFKVQFFLQAKEKPEPKTLKLNL